MKPHPPKLFLRLLRWFCNPELINPIEGDLFEFYNDQLKRYGKRKADLLFAKEVLLLVRRPLFRKLTGTYRSNQLGMFNNYLKFTCRHLIKNPKYTLINTLGLMIGICSSFILFKHTEYFTSSDQEHINKEYIFEVAQQKIGHENEVPPKKRTFFGLAPHAKNNYPLVSKASRYITTIESRVLYERPDGTVVKYNENDIAEADPDFLRMFTFDFIHGDPRHALDAPNTVIITESIAKKYFKEAAAMGKVIKTTAPWGAEYLLTITGVIKDLPQNSSIKFDFLKSLYRKSTETEEDWGFPGFRTFLYIENPDRRQYLSSALSQDLAAMELLADDMRYEIELHALSDIELSTSQQLIVVIAILILIITWTNYGNLYTAKSLNRAKEMAMRKVNGSSGRQILFQFMMESLLIHFIAILGAAMLVIVLYPFFQIMAQGELLPFSENGPVTIVAFTSLLLIGALSSAAYPSLIITRYKPLKILKNKIDLGAKHGLKLPVVIQFVLSAVLIISAWVIKDQMEYLQDKNLKNKSDRTLIISPSKDKWGQKMERFQSFKNEVRSLAEVEQVSSAISIPGRGGNGFIMSNLQNSDELHELHYTEIDVNFAEALNLKLLAGTSFLPGQFHKNRRSAVINASALKAYGLSKEDILGRKVLRRRDGEEKYLEIIGVVEDYHFAPLNQQIGPLLMAYNPFRGHILASLNPSVYDNYDRLTNTIEKLEAAWNQVYDNQVFEIRYLDDEFDYLYRHEISLRALFTVFTCVSIFLSSLGLLGLTMFATLKRKSEVGIRKVLGASIINILVLFSRDFMRQIIIAIVLSMPIAYYLMDQWLQNYSYRTTINTWSFIIPGLALLMISLLTVLSETFKSANMSPSKVLREE